MKNIIKRTVAVVSILLLTACGTNDKGYNLWSKGLASGSRIQYCYYVKVSDESTTYYDALALVAQPSTGGFFPVYTNFKYADGQDTIERIEKDEYKTKYNAVKDGILKGSYGKIVDNR